MNLRLPHAIGRIVSAALSLILPASLWLSTAPALAADEEIQVYLDDMRAPGKFGVDVHNNYVFKGRGSPDYPGEQPPGRVYRLTPEFTYGVTDQLEFGLYLLTTRDAAGSWHGDGAKVRVKFIAPHDAEKGWFWGGNLEIGRTDSRVSETPWNAQFKGILGWRGGAWLLAANPNINFKLSRNGGPVTDSLDLKLNRKVDEKTGLGLEAYTEWGPLRRPDAWNRNSKTVFAVVDHDFGDFDLNLGVGRGLTHEADRWLFKFIVGTTF